MLYDWEFAEDFGLVHLDESLIDFRPGDDSAYVPKLIRVFRERARFHTVYEIYAGYEEKLVFICFDYVGQQEGLGLNLGMS